MDGVVEQNFHWNLDNLICHKLCVRGENSHPTGGGTVLKYHEKMYCMDDTFPTVGKIINP